LFSANRISGRLIYGGVLLVPVRLNGFRLNFLVDTGAAYCSISRKALDQITAKPTDTKVWLAPIGKQPVLASTLKIDNFAVGGITQKNMSVPIVDFPESLQIDGLLGMDFMGKYRITIETDTKTLILREIPKKK
jgi:predicted aspartyl protease